MARDPEIDNPIVPEGRSAEAGKTDQVDPKLDTKHASQMPGDGGADEYAGVEGVDTAYWIGCLEDAERAEQNWRSRAREIVQIYRNEGAAGKKGRAGDGPVYMNVLFANTEVMLPAIFSKPPQPVVRSRFTKVSQPMMPPPPGPLPPGGMAPGVPLPAPPGAPGLPPEMPPPGVSPPGVMAGPPGVMAAGPMPGGPLPPGMPPPGMPPGAPGSPAGALPPPPPPLIDNGPPAMAPPLPGALPGMPPPPAPGLPQPAPNRPPQAAIETAASIMEKALEIVVEDEHSNDSIKLAVKDTLLPGRGVCRVRWKPQMEDKPVEDPVMGGQLMHPETGEPQTQEVKVWEQVGDEYVFWEDLLVDPVRQAADTEWVAFRHLFTAKQLEAEFGGSPQYEDLKARSKLAEIVKWTEESAAKTTIGGGSAMKSAEKLGDHIKKAMIWEIWSRRTREIIWFIREVSGIVLRVDPDSLSLQGFFPIPVPMLAVRTSDTRIPRPYYDLYSKLAADLDETSLRISKLTEQIKVRGGYNSASKEIAQILRADDGKMIGVEGVDMLNGGLQNHIWLVPIEQWITALDKLYLAREQQKQAIYEIMGISDIMRGATKASETATAQRIKGSMGVNRLDDAKSQSDNFVRDLLRLKAEIIGQNFSPETLEAMTGEACTPDVLAILRSDFQRTCSIDIESDSTVAVDEQVEQQSMAMIMQSVQAVMTGAVAMLQTGILPPPMVMQLSLELLKMFLHPVRYSRGVVELIDQFQEQLTAQIGMMAMAPPGAPGMGAPPPPGGPGGMGPIPPSPPGGAPKGGPPGGGRPPGSNPDIPPLRANGNGAPPPPF